MKQAMRAYLFLSQKPVTIISLCATFVITLLVWKIEATIDPSGGGMAGLQLAFTVERVRVILSSWRDGGADLFLRTVWLNYLYALSLSVLLSSAPGYFARQRIGFSPDAVPRRDVIYSLVPFIACLCEWAVQSMLVVLFSGGAINDYLVCAISVTVLVKWLILAWCLAILLRSYFLTRKEKRRAGR